VIALKFSGEDLVEAVREIFTCRTCNKEGMIPNPSFEACRKDGESWDCNSCYYRDECDEGEIIICPDCQGEGYERLSWEEFFRRLMEDADNP